MGACCGNDKPSTTPAGVSSGRKRSVLLLVIAIAIALAFQYGAAYYIVNNSINNVVTNAWLDGCDDYATNTLKVHCAGQSGVYRVGFSALIFFSIAATAVVCRRTANREGWPAKYTLFVFFTIAMCFVPNEPLFTNIFLNIARVGSAFFILFQQVIVVDIAHNWNDGWVERSNKAESDEIDSGKNWLIAIVISAAFFFLISVVGWGLLFYYFGGCNTNICFVSTTIILTLFVTIAQLTGNEGSLLSSSLVTAYATILCYSAVSQNPNDACNPQQDSANILSILTGMLLTIVSLGYVGWSTTADTTLGTNISDDEDEEYHVKNNKAATSTSPEEKPKIVGMIANVESVSIAEDKELREDADEASSRHVPNTFSNNWMLNFALTIITCWFSMVLTGFGSTHANNPVENSQTSEVTMWIIMGSQWSALLLYTWTLIAPQIFPDRDFS